MPNIPLVPYAASKKVNRITNITRKWLNRHPQELYIIIAIHIYKMPDFE